jgi:hypothetical protein
MATYPPPTENLSAFNSVVFEANNTPLTYDEAAKSFLKYPTAQGAQAFSTITTTTANITTAGVSGTATIGTMNATTAGVSGTATIGTMNATTAGVSGTGTIATLNSTTGAITTLTGTTATIGTVNATTLLTANSITANTGTTITLGTTSDTIKYNKMSPLYTTLPTFATADVGYTYTPTITLAASAGDIGTQSVGVGVWLITFFINVSAAGTSSLSIRDATGGLGTELARAMEVSDTYTATAVLSVSTGTKDITIRQNGISIGVGTGTQRWTITRIA